MARPRTMFMPSWILYVSAIALSLLSGRAAAQEVCACSPSTYTFTLDFSLTCPPVSVTRNPGITATFCQISPFGDGNETITDMVPVEVRSVGVLELGQEFEVLSQTNFTGPFVDGDELEYESIAGVEGFDGEIPKVIQLNIFATNALGEPIVNFFAISYSNSCEDYPTLIEGDSAGWTSFTTLADPSRDLCPAVPTTPPTDSPTESPTKSAVIPPPIPTEASVVPTEAPVESTTDTPTDSDSTVEPTVESTTDAPTDSDSTVEPTVEPTDEPDEDQTEAPVEPTDPPIAMSMELSVEDIVMEMVMSMSMSMSMDVATSMRGGAFVKLAEVKSEKSHKKEKSDKKAKSAKKEKSDKKEKSAKTKSAKKEKRRRLRVRPIYQAD